MVINPGHCLRQKISGNRLLRRLLAIIFLRRFSFLAFVISATTECTKLKERYLLIASAHVCLYYSKFFQHSNCCICMHCKLPSLVLVQAFWIVDHEPSACLPCPALPCPALPCPALPCPALPCPALPCAAFRIRVVLCLDLLPISLSLL